MGVTKSYLQLGAMRNDLEKRLEQDEHRKDTVSAALFKATLSSECLFMMASYISSSHLF